MSFNGSSCIAFWFSSHEMLLAIIGGAIAVLFIGILICKCSAGNAAPQTHAAPLLSSAQPGREQAQAAMPLAEPIVVSGVSVIRPSASASPAAITLQKLRTVEAKAVQERNYQTAHQVGLHAQALEELMTRMSALVEEERAKVSAREFAAADECGEAIKATGVKLSQAVEEADAFLVQQQA